MSVSGGLGPYIFHRKVEKTQPLREEMDGKVFISRQSRHFLFIVNVVKKLSPICTLNWRVNNYIAIKKRYQEENREYCYIGISSQFDYQPTVEIVTSYLFTITFFPYSPKLT